MPTYNASPSAMMRAQLRSGSVLLPDLFQAHLGRSSHDGACSASVGAQAYGAPDLTIICVSERLATDHYSLEPSD